MKTSYHSTILQSVGMRTEEFVNQFFQEAEASVLPEKVVEASKSLAETMTVHLKQPAPPIKVR